MPGISVLGPVTLEGGDGDPVVPGSRRQRLLLALLVGRAPRPVTADALVEALWGDGALPAHPAAALQSQVFRLRRQLGTAGIDLVTEGSGYRLAVTCDDVDADRFALLVARAGEPSAAPAAALALLDEALGLWRGRAYEEVADHDAVRGEALRLEELRAEASEARAALLIGVGRAHEAARAMEALAADHPFRERPVALRMQALAATGRHGEALAALAAFRRELAEELGLEPSPELARLEGELVRHERPAVARPGLPGNSLVGREVELAAVTARLRAGRLVTLTGPGGVGKSRLALHAAVRAAPEHPDGVFLCELAEVVADEAVAPAVATALRIQRGGGATDTDGIVDVLATRRALVVLDNCEHVLDGARALVAAVLAGAAEVDVLATSRRRLGVEGEQVIPVAPLPVPERDDPEAPAVVLFVDRVRDLRPDFALDRATTAAACALCRLVDGLPLAIELAAARAVALSPAEIVADVAGRLHRLGDPARSRERHRSIEAVVAGSYDPLPPVERRVARTVAVFAGGFTLGAAAEVAGVDPGEAGAALTSLVETSLVVARDAGGITRFSMLEPVRQFAEARAAEDGTAERARARHAAWAARWIEAADAGLRGPDEAAWAGTIGAEMANLRAAHGWCLTNDLATAVRIAGALYWHGYWYGGTEAFGWATATVARAGAGAGPSGTSPPDQGPPGRGTPVPPSPPAALAAAYGTAALGAVRRGDIAEARALAGRGIALADDPTSRFAWEALSSAELLSGRYEQAMACQQRAREGRRRSGTPRRRHASTRPALWCSATWAGATRRSPSSRRRRRGRPRRATRRWRGSAITSEARSAWTRRPRRRCRGSSPPGTRPGRSATRTWRPSRGCRRCRAAPASAIPRRACTGTPSCSTTSTARARPPSSGPRSGR